jgi:predicted RNA-binding Zn-ribbon protein involved in translation (DUF1610 family)
MDRLIQLVIGLGIVFGVPIMLGMLATGRTRCHRGPAACASCRYELTGIDGTVHRCPECGLPIAGDGTLRAGVDRFRANPWWVRYPAVMLLLVAPFGVAFEAFGMYFASPALRWVPWALLAGYCGAVWWVCRIPASRLKRVVGGTASVVPGDTGCAACAELPRAIDPVRQAMIAAHIIETQSTPPASS